MTTHYHFIGIGGIGMSGIAQLILRCGGAVSGSDLAASGITAKLESLGARIFIGQRPENIAGAHQVIYSSAIKADNPEMQEALRRGIPLVKRAEVLAQLMKDKCVITVAGSHGKTTTTSLTAYLLIQAGLSPTVAVGGILRNVDSNACLGNGTYFVAEADESDGSFLCYRPKYSIVTNIDYEHLDYYKTFEKQIESFRDFIGSTEESGCVFCCGDDLQLKKIIGGFKGRSIFFGLDKSADIHPRNIQIEGLRSEFDCFYRGKFVERFFLSLGGEHNISNSLAVIGLGLELGIDILCIRETLRSYGGARRRLEVKWSDGHYTFVDDYAHHPTEIQATLAALRHMHPRRIVVVFQPHRYSRTQLLLDQFGKSFRAADYLIVTDIYPAGEAPLEGVSAEVLWRRIRQDIPDKDVVFLPKEQITGHLLQQIQPGDVVVTLGAGDIVTICDALVQEFASR